MLAKATLRDLRQEYAGTVRLRCGQGKSARLRVGRFGLATTLLNLVNILDFGMDPKIAVDQPNYRSPFIGTREARARKGIRYRVQV